MKITDAQHTPSQALATTRALTMNAGGHLAAASGLVKVGQWFWVVADDENHVGRFSDSHGERVRVFAGELSQNTAERKAQKPDLEALVYLDKRQSGLKDDALLAIASGSRPTRYRGAIIPVTPNGDTCGEITTIDLSLVYAHLASTLTELNIEGAAIVGTTLKLAQRGPPSAIIDLDLAQVAQALRHQRPIPKSAVMSIKPLTLDALDGTPLSVTDIAALADGRLVFTAAAEATSNAYDDGVVKGSVIGIIGKDGRATNVTRVTPITKLEGVCVLADGRARLELALVCDPDDPTRPATLYRTTLELQ